MSDEVWAEYRRSLINGVLTTLFFACLLGVVGVTSWAANRVTLWWVYGPERVARDGLRIVADKPVLTVSNGDRLEGPVLPHFLLTGAGLPVGAALFVAALRLLPPGRRGLTAPGPATGVTHGVLLFVPQMLVFTFCIAVGSFTAALAFVPAAVGVAWAAERAGWTGAPVTPAADGPAA